MKKLFTFLLVAVCLVLLGNTADAQTTLFTETMGSPGGTTTIASYTGWSNNGTLTYSNGGATNPGDVRNTSASTGYAGASGTGNIFLTSTSGSYGFSIESINASAYTSLNVQFGWRKENGAGAGSLPTLALDYWNGSSWVNVPYSFTQTTNSGTGWYLSPVINLPVGAQISGLKLRWVKSGTVAVRLDDVVLKGTSGGASPPTLNAAGSATVDAPFNVTFSDDATWRGLITGITVGGTPLTAGYSVSSGQITFTPSASVPAGLLQSSGTKTISVTATGYSDASVSQTIGVGAPNKLGIGTQPTAPGANGNTLAQQPVIRIQDQYGNTTTSTANVTANVGLGTWTIGGTATVAGVAGTVTFTNLTATSVASVTGATIDFTSTGLTHIESATFDIPAPVTQGLQLSSVNTSYLIDFDNTVANVNNGAYNGAGFTTSPSTGQLNSLSWAVTGWTDGSLAFGGSNTTGDYARGNTTVAVSTGGMYSFSNGGNKSFGIQPGSSDWEPGTVTLKVQNKTGSSATSLLISYKILIRNDQDRSSSFNLSTSDDNASYTNVDSLNTTSTAALDAAGFRTYIRVALVTLNVANNGYYYIRWSGAAVSGSGSRDEFAIDDINIIVNPTSQYPSFSGTCEDVKATGNFGLSSNLTVNSLAAINSGLFLGANNLVGAGTPVLRGSGTIDLTGDLSTQISGFTSNVFAGSYYFSGSGQSIPTGSYSNPFRIDGTVSLGGDLTLSNTLTINGTLTVGAHRLIVSGTSISRTSGGIDASNPGATVEFTNGSTLTIAGSSFTGNINNLTLTGSGLVTSNQNLTVANTLTLGASSSFLNMGANTLTLGTSTSNVGTLTRNGGAIRGSFKRWIASSTGARLFPLDNGSGSYSAATVDFTVAPTGGSLTATFHNSAPGNLPLGPNGIDNYIEAPEMHVNLVNIAPQWWTVTADDGLTGGTYNMDITGDGIVNVGDYRFIALLKRSNSGNPWTWTSGFWTQTSGSNTNPVLHMTGVNNGFSDFGVGGNVDNLLPVELSNFTSVVSGTNVNLNWTTSMEQNNSGFDIERKSTVTGWTKIANVEGHGNSNTANSYTYSDRNLNSGKYNYRLKQIDYNGNYKYYELSNEVTIGTPSKYALVQNYPNPFNPSTSISYEIPASNFVSLKIYDMMGREVADLVNQTQDAGFYTVKFDASKLSSGIYFYKLVSDKFSATKKLMLLK